MAKKVFTDESLSTFISEIKTYTDNAVSTKANSSHSHAISDVNGLQTALNGKAASSHGTHVSYSTTAPVMSGTASTGSASTVARSDHKHPTDTSRASKTSLDSHTSNKSNPHGVTLAQLGITATATELNTLDGITATVTELNFVDGVTSNIQTQLNGKAVSSHTHSISNITNLQTTLDGKAASSHTHTVANISDLTATAKELNYMDGVTSNVQTQLDGKLSLNGGSITGKLNINNINSNPLTLRRNSGDSESVTHSLNDNTYTIGYTNDEATNKIVFSLSATDTETNGSASPSESLVTILNSNNKSTVTANVFSGSLSGNATTATTATNVAWSGVTSKPSYYDAKAIKSITRSGTTFTYTCMDGTTGTFTQQDNNTTYSVATSSANGLMSATDKSKLDGMVLATVTEVKTYLGI